MNEDEIRQLTADVINGKKELSGLSGNILFSVARRLLKMKRIELVIEASKVAKERLIRKGYRFIEGFGWIVAEDLPKMGIGQVYGKWTVTDVEKFKRYEFKPTQKSLYGK